MPDRTLTKQQAHAAYHHLQSLDPDEAEAVLDSVIWNRKALEPHATEYDRKRQAAIQGHIETDGEEVRRVEEGDEVRPLEAELGVHLVDDAPMEKIASEIRAAGHDEVTVTLATEPISALQEVADTLDDWHFMIEVDV